MMQAVTDWLALALMLGAIVAGCGAAMTRTLYSLVMYVAAAAAFVAAALLALGAGDGALAAALLGVGLAPFLLLAAMLLSSRTAKPRQHGRPWLTIATAAAAASVIFWTLPDLGTPVQEPLDLQAPRALAPWIAPLIVVAAAACVGLLGFGERGAFSRRSDGQ